MRRLLIARCDFAQVVSHCRAEFPSEACGLLLGRGCRVRKVRPLINAEPGPHRYRAHPDDQVAAFADMEREGLSLLAIYHSHPGGVPQPSPSDLSQAYYPGSLYLIIAGPPWPEGPGDEGLGLWDLAAPLPAPARLEIAAPAR